MNAVCSATASEPDNVQIVQDGATEAATVDAPVVTVIGQAVDLSPSVMLPTS